MTDWWSLGDVGVRARTEPVRAVVLHHTGGERDAAGVCRTLRRKRLSIHYVVDYDGTVTQHADHDVVTMHAGAANGWTIGIEVVNRAAPLWPAFRERRQRPRLAYQDTVHGRRRTMLRFTAPQVDACRLLCARLCAEYGLPLDVPRSVYTGELITDALPPSVLSWYRGILGHFHVTRKKWDPVPHLLRDVVAP